MAIITGGSLATEAQVTAGALRMVEYEPSGAARRVAPVGAYMVPLNIDMTVAVAATNLVWALTNNGTKNVYVTRLCLHTGFAGTAAVTQALWELLRFTAGPPTGGTAITVIKKKTTYPASSVGDVRVNGGAALTLGTAVLDTAFLQLSTARQLQAGNDLVLSLEEQERILIAPGEGLGFALGVAAVVGDFVAGSIHWIEETP